MSVYIPPEEVEGRLMRIYGYLCGYLRTSTWLPHKSDATATVLILISQAIFAFVVDKRMFVRYNQHIEH